MNLGKCRLCSCDSELQDSHLLPKALYRMIGRGSNPTHPDTVQFTEGMQKKSSEQASRHLLCWDCEQLLSRNGEQWVLRNCYRGQGRFRLRTEVTKRPALSQDEVTAYSASGEEMTKLAYFSLSVIWRASLCDWFCRGQKYDQFELGSYQEEVSRYLKGDAAVPSCVGVMVVLSALQRPWLAMCLPLVYRQHSYHCYRFHIPGITFVATFGGTNCGDVEDRVSMIHPPNPILVGSLGDRKVQDEMMLAAGYALPIGCQAPLAEGTERPEAITKPV